MRSKRNDSKSTTKRLVMPSIVVHGGAYDIPKDHERRHLAGVARAARAGYAILAEGGSAIDACEAAVRVLEDDPVFDAGYGSVLNADGEVEMDAVLCDGSSVDFGSVCAIRNIRHPISVARKVLEATSHCILVGDNAKKFALKHGFKHSPTSELVTADVQDEFKRMDKFEKSGLDHDTVGCVCRDAFGNIASGTSTGGITAKLPGRVGDSPIFGAGAYADSSTCGVSATGHGESILRTMLSARIAWGFSEQQKKNTKKDVCHRPSSSGNNGSSVIKQELDVMLSMTGGRGGAIAVSAENGACSVFHTTSKMSWAAVSTEGVLVSGLGHRGCSSGSSLGLAHDDGGSKNDQINGGRSSGSKRTNTARAKL
eukprot:jgi/Bigna1/75895/fgenesh1_pg.37_\